MTIEQIEAAIPHRTPMLLLDEICEETGDRLVCRKTFSATDFFVQGHFPGQPIVPGVIQCECCLQAGAVLLGRRAQLSSGIPVATRIDNVKFKRMVQPGETVEVTVELQEQLSNAYFFTGRVTVAGKLACRLDFAVALADSSQTSHS